MCHELFTSLICLMESHHFFLRRVNMPNCESKKNSTEKLLGNSCSNVNPESFIGEYDL
jgi:hypothetical protein